MARKAFDQIVADEESASSVQELDCLSFSVCQHHMWEEGRGGEGASAEKFILHQCHVYHVVSFAESHVIRERCSSVEAFSSPQEIRFSCVVVSPSGKSVKGSHGAALFNWGNGRKRGRPHGRMEIRASSKPRGLVRLHHGVHDADRRCPMRRERVQAPSDIGFVVEIEVISLSSLIGTWSPSSWKARASCAWLGAA